MARLLDKCNSTTFVVGGATYTIGKQLCRATTTRSSRRLLPQSVDPILFFFYLGVRVDVRLCSGSTHRRPNEPEKEQERVNTARQNR